MAVDVEDDLKEDIRNKIVESTENRGSESSICPSEAARAVGKEKDIDWRELMDLTGEVVGELSEEGRINVTQAGEEVDIQDANGPVRLSMDD